MDHHRVLTNGRTRLLVLASCLLTACALDAQSFTADALLTLRGMTAGGPATWLEHGGGRLDASANRGLGVAQLGADWNPSDRFGAHVQLLGRSEPSSYGGRRAGVVEAYAQAASGGWQLRAGQFFLPTSRENTGPLWTTPYTLNLSALNSWIAHEFRPIGADVQWRGGHVSLGTTAFRGNDASGALLGWRGWTISNRLSVHGETLPLPPLPAFVSQKNGTTAFGKDLDGRTGFAGRVRFSVPDRGLIQIAHVDNRGDRALHRGEYAWKTRFDVVSAEAGSTDGTRVAAEYAFGKTGMGVPPGAFVQADIYSGYALVSQKMGSGRLSARFDLFATIDRDHSTGGNTTEHGRAWVIAWMFDATPHLRAGVELAQVTGRRDLQFDARSVTAELRYSLR